MSEIARHLMAWARGDRPVGQRTIVLDNAEHLAAVLDSGLADEATVFAPGAAGESAGSARIVGYDGSFGELDGEVALPGDFYLQTQTYGIASFMSVVGPTLLRMSGTADLDAYLADADQAWRTGEFAEHATHPLVHIADLPALGAAPAGDGPASRLYVAADGQLSTSPTGRGLGVLGDDLEALSAVWQEANESSRQPCAVCLGGVVPEEKRLGELAERPWLRRYLVVLDALRDAKARGVGRARVSGFGGRLVPGLAELPVPADSHAPWLPVLHWHDQTAQLHDPITGRTFQLGIDAARLLEIFLLAGSASLAAEWAGKLLGLSGATAQDGLGQLVGRFTELGLRLPAAELEHAGRQC